ncbi:MAG: hypothetical protein FWH10_01725, partial [Oscillospiraceae bacterium]|nr:hypothetical protein [Oscillospiraceae bacterium]
LALEEKNMLNNINNIDNINGSLDIYISDKTLNFERAASNFLGLDIKSGVIETEKINIEKY